MKSIVHTVLALLPLGLVAQQPQPVTQTLSPAVLANASRPATLGAMTTDTGDLAHGRITFERYRTPSVCLAAAHNARTVLRRSIAAQLEADSLRYDPVRDTLPAGVAAVARACSRRFPVANAAPDALPDLFELALLAGDDSLATAVLTRRVALASDAEDRAELQQRAVTAYLAAEPARLALAERVTAQLDKRGTGAELRLARAQTHLTLLRFYVARFTQQPGDATRLRQEAAQIMALSRGVPTQELEPYRGPLTEAYRALLTVAFFTAPDSVLPLARQAQQDIGRIPEPPRRPEDAPPVPFAQLPLDRVLEELCPVASFQRQALATPRLTADVWFPAAAKDTVLPARGRVSLFVHVTGWCDGSYDLLYGGVILDPISTGCYGLYERLRHWHERYGAAGLDITLVAAVAPGLSGTVLRGPQSLDQAAQNLRWYFLDYLKLPVQRLAVQAASVTPPLPLPDGRMFSGPVPFSQTYLHSSSGLNGLGGTGDFVLTDRTGVEVYRGDISYSLAPASIFESLLQRVVTGPALAAPSTTPSVAAPPRSAAVPSSPRSAVSTLQSGELR